jgi:hypothetical protein
MDRCRLRPPHDVERNRLRPRIGEGWAGPLKASMRLVQASQASLSAARRASVARWAAMRTEVP